MAIEVSEKLMQLKIALFNTFYEEEWFETVMNDKNQNIVLIVNTENDISRSLALNGWEGIPVKVVVSRIGSQEFNRHVVKHD